MTDPFKPRPDYSDAIATVVLFCAAGFMIAMLGVAFGAHHGLWGWLQ